MKKIFLILGLFLICKSVYAAPSTNLSITPAAVDATVIAASDVNTRNNAITTWANAHNHTDIIVNKARDADGNTQIQTEEATDENIIRMDTNGTERWNMTAAGERTMTTQPAFNATVASNQNNFTTVIDVVFGTEIFDQSNDFNNTTGIFTAPVTGRYHLSFTLRISNFDADATEYTWTLTTSNRTYNMADGATLYRAGGDADHNIFFSVLTDMDANDTAKVTIEQAGGTAQSDILAIPSNTFTGFLAL